MPAKSTSFQTFLAVLIVSALIITTFAVPIPVMQSDANHGNQTPEDSDISIVNTEPTAPEYFTALADDSASYFATCANNIDVLFTVCMYHCMSDRSEEFKGSPEPVLENLTTLVAEEFRLLQCRVACPAQTSDSKVEICIDNCMYGYGFQPETVPTNPLEHCKIGCAEAMDDSVHKMCIDICLYHKGVQPELSPTEKLTPANNKNLATTYPIARCQFACTTPNKKDFKICVDHCLRRHAEYPEGYFTTPVHPNRTNSKRDGIPESNPEDLPDDAPSDLPFKDRGFFDCRKGCTTYKPLGQKAFMGCVYNCLRCPKGLHHCGWFDKAVKPFEAEASAFESKEIDTMPVPVKIEEATPIPKEGPAPESEITRVPPNKRKRKLTIE